MTLTEQWKKGELEQGYYYTTVEDYNGVSRNIANYYNKDICFHHILVKEVLAPVPSYEEWNQLHKFLEEFNALEVAKENQHLKDLLKECRNYINKVAFCTPNCYKTLMEDLLTKIDNAIGEKK